MGIILFKLLIFSIALWHLKHSKNFTSNLRVFKIHGTSETHWTQLLSQSTKWKQLQQCRKKHWCAFSLLTIFLEKSSGRNQFSAFFICKNQVDSKCFIEIPGRYMSYTEFNKTHMLSASKKFDNLPFNLSMQWGPYIDTIIDV